MLDSESTFATTDPETLGHFLVCPARPRRFPQRRVARWELGASARATFAVAQESHPRSHLAEPAQREAILAEPAPLARSASLQRRWSSDRDPDRCTKCYPNIGLGYSFVPWTRDALWVSDADNATDAQVLRVAELLSDGGQMYSANCATALTTCARVR